MIVMKFGGSSVGTPETMRQAASLARRFQSEQPVLVVSALQGVTDELIGLANASLRGERMKVESGTASLSVRHCEAAAALGGAESDRLEIERLIDDLANVLRGVGLLKELSPRSLDLVVSFGERLSAPLVALACRAEGVRAEAVDSRSCIVTDDRFGAARVDFESTDRRAAEVLRPMLARGLTPVVTGFIGAATDGATTTLGRGGSDYSVSIIARALGADEIWIWKEVDGVMTADPRVVPDAALLERLSYDEAAEMSFFGAKVLHPKTMIPAIERRIPIRLRNTFRPEARGTVIGTETSSAPFGAKVVTAAGKLAIVTIEGKGMAGIAGFAAHVFAVAGRAKVNILMFSQSSSEQSICLVIESKDAGGFRAALEQELHDEFAARAVERIAVETGVAAVAVVGDGMRGCRGVAARVFGAAAAAGASVLAIAQGSSERSISFVVKEEEAADVVRAVHAAFALEKMNSLTVFI